MSQALDPVTQRHVDNLARGLVHEFAGMGCGDACPIYPGKKYEDWELDDPAGKDLETVRRIRDELDQRVRKLIAELAPHSGATN